MECCQHPAYTENGGQGAGCHKVASDSFCIVISFIFFPYLFFPSPIALSLS